MLQPLSCGVEESDILRSLALSTSAARDGGNRANDADWSLPSLNDCFTLEAIIKLRDAIINNTRNAGDGLTFKTFCDVMQEFSHDLRIVQTIFRKIDVDNTGYVSLSPYTAFLLSLDDLESWSKDKNTSRFVLRNDLIAPPISLLSQVIKYRFIITNFITQIMDIGDKDKFILYFHHIRFVLGDT